MRWIRVEASLVTKCEILQIAAILGVSPHEAVGLCVHVWAWADGETEDGQLPGCVPAMVDGIVGHPGLADAMIRVGWLKNGDTGMCIPHFDRYHGKSAKKRAADAKRLAIARGTY